MLEVGFGTGLNLKHYGEDVRALWGIDPMKTAGVPKVEDMPEVTVTSVRGIRSLWSTSRVMFSFSCRVIRAACSEALAPAA